MSALARLTPESLVTVNPVEVASPGRPLPLFVRVTAPATGERLPVVLFSHGHSADKDDYLRLTESWAARGVVVVQPTHLDSARQGLERSDPRHGDNWRIRADDARTVIDALEDVVAASAVLAGRVDTRRVIVAGHSFGGFTAELLGGVRPYRPGDRTPVDFRHPKVVGIIGMATPGGGGENLQDLSEGWRTVAPWLDRDWSALAAPILVIAGEADHDPYKTTRGDWTWHADSFHLAPDGDKGLLVMTGARHYLGGILGPNRTEVGGDAPASVALVQAATGAFIDAVFSGQGAGWKAAVATAAAAAPNDGVFTGG